MPLASLKREVSHQRMILHRLQAQDQQSDLREAVMQGLNASPKSMRPKFFYDEQGSLLFERITETKDYYPTAAEREILHCYSEEIIDVTGKNGLNLVELGSGSSNKTRILLDAIERRTPAFTYVPIDISPTIVESFGQKLLEDYPQIHIEGLICDYHHAMAYLAENLIPHKLIIFLGSSLGNFDPQEARHLLKDVAHAMLDDDFLLIGLDLIKDSATLHRAYNDSEGVTAAFNMNLLRRINHDLDANFNLDQYRHYAFSNPQKKRVEMHIESLKTQEVQIDALDMRIRFQKGETIHTESSYKFDPSSLSALLEGSGLTLERQWLDKGERYSLNLIRKAA